MTTKQLERLKALAVGLGNQTMAESISASIADTEAKRKEATQHWKVRRQGESFQQYQNRVSEAQGKQLIAKAMNRQERIRELFGLACKQDLEAMAKYDQAMANYSSGIMKAMPERPSWEATIWQVLSADPRLSKELTEIINRDGSRSHHRDAFPTHRFDAVEQLLKEAGIEPDDDHKFDKILSQISEDPGLNSTGELLSLKLGADSSAVPSGKAQYNERANELRYRSQNRRASKVACLPWSERSNANRIISAFIQEHPGTFSCINEFDKEGKYGESKWVRVAKQDNDKAVSIKYRGKRVSALRRITTILRTPFMATYSYTQEIKRYYIEVSGAMKLVKTRKTLETLVTFPDGSSIPCTHLRYDDSHVAYNHGRLTPVDFTVSNGKVERISQTAKTMDSIQRPEPSIYTPSEADSVLSRCQRRSPWDYVSSYDPNIPSLRQQTRFSASNNDAGSIKVDTIQATPASTRNTTPISFDRSYRPKSFSGQSVC